jgi:nitrate reductase delta subunit
MNLYELFAEILDYPSAQQAACIQDCDARLTRESPESAELLQRFQASKESVRLGRLQEAYTSIFDMQPECTLNLGYQLFGDDWRRSIFLFKLKEIYQANAFDTSCELPDHLCILLRFLSARDGTNEASELVDDCLIPALSRMAGSVQLGESSYRWVLKALLLWLQKKREVRGPGCESSDQDRATRVAIAATEERLA